MAELLDYEGSHPSRSANESASCRSFRTDHQESELLRAFGANFPLPKYSQRSYRNDLPMPALRQCERVLHLS